MKKVSVIVPIYRVEKYLEVCVLSLLNQTYQNLEIILVDDGSDDNCPEICDKLSQKDKRIVVIHKENGGLSDARNTGLKIATGEFIAFVDSDDIVDSMFIECLYNIIENEKCDISICGIQKFKSEVNVTENRKRDEDIVIISPIECFYKTDALFEVAWNKLYKRDIFGKITYPLGKVHEDIYTTYKVIMRAFKIGITSEQLYFYRQRTDSITGGIENLPKLDIEQAYWERVSYFKKFDNKAYTEALKAYSVNVVKLLSAIKKRQIPANSQRVETFKMRCQKVLKQVICSRRVTLLKKFEILICSFLAQF